MVHVNGPGGWHHFRQRSARRRINSVSAELGWPRATRPQQDHEIPRKSDVGAATRASKFRSDARAGGRCRQMLADLGAEVIKIERPGGGDDARAFGPSYHRPRRQRTTTTRFISAPTATRNRSPSTSRTLKARIVREPQILRRHDGELQGRRFQRYRLIMNRSGAQPRIIYCSVTGFGQTGPYAPRAGYDAILHMRADERHRPYRWRARRRPMKVGPRRRLHDRHELIDRYLPPSRKVTAGGSRSTLPVDTVTLHCRIGRRSISSTARPSAARHWGRRHAGGRVPLHRRRIDARSQ